MMKNKNQSHVGRTYEFCKDLPYKQWWYRNDFLKKTIETACVFLNCKNDSEEELLIPEETLTFLFYFQEPPFGVRLRFAWNSHTAAKVIYGLLVLCFLNYLLLTSLSTEMT